MLHKPDFNQHYGTYLHSLIAVEPLSSTKFMAVPRLDQSIWNFRFISQQPDTNIL